jgi:predicted TIM-barrel fold metal-dependent hydrolase
MIPLITLEEHFFAQEIGQAQTYIEQFKWLPGLLDKLNDIGPLRLAEMNKGGVSLQVVSHGPGLGTVKPQTCTDANNQLHAAIEQNPTRFAGFAVLPMSAPEDAANELKRSVKELGFVGALVDNHVDGTMYDGERFRCIFSAAQELDVPIYLHPTWPDETLKPRFQGNFGAGASLGMASSAFGWHVDTGLHILKLFASGLFDSYPRLKLIIGHFGETLPFMLERIEVLSRRWGERERDFRTVWDENVYITTSGVWSLNPLRTILGNTKIEHVLYSVDYPFAKNEDGLKWMEELEKSGLVDRDGLEKIGYRNAEKLLRVKAPQ